MSDPFGGRTEVDAAEAIGLSSLEGVWLFDVREQGEWDGGHAAGAHHIPMNEIGERQGELPDDLAILVICHSGARSRRVTDALLGADYRAANVSGGLMAWQAASGPVVVDGSDAV
ncbi:rhodanese-like domain-containing protein [Compostimonas suwonensis]|uniref:Rhodanese-related sulfurtransferase n=1 Tax=Compostimonas suwonensis TaxID=1048394 RepID=A0A2M9BBU7_9MICO|nr:rhodanese-like domain-containing protein [Compostimonas suwonensis]PJJ55402.1 rhodanese-related sulfurtransferase [Compostimonas suwonensis]